MSDVPSSWILSEAYAGLQAQGLGLAEAAGLSPVLREIAARAPWKFIAAKLWPRPLNALPPGQLVPPWPSIVVACGGTGAAVGVAMQAKNTEIVAVQHPRMDPRKFRLVVVNRHDGLTGPNVLVTRMALHRVTQARLDAARMQWADRFAALPRPLVSVLIGGSNGRFRLDGKVAGVLAAQLAAMMRADRVGLVLTPSRRTDPAVVKLFTETLAPLGAWVWDGTDENPYFGMLALSDLVVVTEDSVSMISEAMATTAPVMLARLPGRSRRIGQFIGDVMGSGRVRAFTGRYEPWPVAPINDTLEAGAEMRRRLGY